MQLCVGTSKGIVILEGERLRAPIAISATPSTVWCMAQSAVQPEIIYAGSIEPGRMGDLPGLGNLSRSTDGGRSWSDITPTGAHGEEIWAVVTAPDDPGEVFVGTSHARMFRSEDYGRSFSECRAFLDIPGRERWTFPPPPHIPHVRTIVFDRADSSIMYVGVEEGGVFRSLDRGGHFEHLSTKIYPDIHSIAVDPENPSHLFVTTGRGFYRSHTSGQSWQFIRRGITRPYVVSLALDTNGTGSMYVAGAAGPPPSWISSPHGADAAIFLSRDGGNSFVTFGRPGELHRGMIMRMAQSPFPPHPIFAVTSEGKVLRWRPDEEGVAEIASNLPPAYALAILP